MPTVKRDETYLYSTLNSLINACTQDELQQILIVVFISEIFDSSFVTNTTEKLKSMYKYEIEKGLMDVVVPPLSFYPDLESLGPDFIYNDPVDRVKWRTKQNYDVVYLMNYAKKRAPYYLQVILYYFISMDRTMTYKRVLLSRRSYRFLSLNVRF